MYYKAYIYLYIYIYIYNKHNLRIRPWVGHPWYTVRALTHICSSEFHIEFHTDLLFQGMRKGGGRLLKLCIKLPRFEYVPYAQDTNVPTTQAGLFRKANNRCK